MSFAYSDDPRIFYTNVGSRFTRCEICKNTTLTYNCYEISRIIHGERFDINLLAYMSIVGLPTGICKNICYECFRSRQINAYELLAFRHLKFAVICIDGYAQIVGGDCRFSRCYRCGFNTYCYALGYIPDDDVFAKIANWLIGARHVDTHTNTLAQMFANSDYMTTSVFICDFCIHKYEIAEKS